jgi:hypothetical protein
LLLLQELEESDILGYTTICSCVDKAYNDYLKQLEKDMAVGVLLVSMQKENLFYCRTLRKFSFTTDTWSDPNHSSFMAVTAHWIESVDEKIPTGI